MIKFKRSDVKTILFKADAYLRDSIGQHMVLEKVKPLNYEDRKGAGRKKRLVST